MENNITAAQCNLESLLRLSLVVENIERAYEELHKIRVSGDKAALLSVGQRLIESGSYVREVAASMQEVA